MSYDACCLDFESLVKWIRHNAILPFDSVLREWDLPVWLERLFPVLPSVLGSSSCIVWHDYTLFFPPTLWNVSMKYKGNHMYQSNSTKWSISKFSCYDNIKLHHFMWFKKNFEAKLFFYKKLLSELVFPTKFLTS